jgi:hypothetical protein
MGLTLQSWAQLAPSQKAVLVSRSGMVPAFSIASFIAQIDALYAQSFGSALYASPYASPYGYAQQAYASPFGYSGYGYAQPAYYSPFGYSAFNVPGFGDRASPNLATSPHSNANPNVGGSKPAGFVRPAGQAVAVGASVSGLLGVAVGAVGGYFAAKKHWLGL